MFRQTATALITIKPSMYRRRTPVRSCTRMDFSPYRAVLVSHNRPAGWIRVGVVQMPTYQYRCEKCGHLFEHAEHLAEHESAHPRCPKCGSETCQHVPTPFVAKTSKKS